MTVFFKIFVFTATTSKLCSNVNIKGVNYVLRYMLSRIFVQSFVTICLILKEQLQFLCFFSTM